MPGERTLGELKSVTMPCTEESLREIGIRVSDMDRDIAAHWLNWEDEGRLIPNPRPYMPDWYVMAVKGTHLQEIAKRTGFHITWVRHCIRYPLVFAVLIRGRWW